MIFVTGDTHGTIDFHKLNMRNFAQQKELTRDDCLIILGDFGGIWDGSKEDEWICNWHQNKNYTTLFLDGNHENFDLLYQYPLEDWQGGKVRKIRPNLYHLDRGSIFTLAGKTFFVCGGANSVDKAHRKAHISWWPQELPNVAETNRAIDNLAAHNNSVDYILTHTAPQRIVRRMFGSYFDDPIDSLLTNLDREISFRHWYFGHLHMDMRWDCYSAVYNNIIRVC